MDTEHCNHESNTYQGLILIFCADGLPSKSKPYNANNLNRYRQMNTLQAQLAKTHAQADRSLRSPGWVVKTHP